MNKVVADYPEREIHVILDNLSTHKPKRDLWLARHPNVHLHYTPTHTSRLKSDRDSVLDPQREVVERCVLPDRPST